MPWFSSSSNSGSSGSSASSRTSVINPPESNTTGSTATASSTSSTSPAQDPIQVGYSSTSASYSGSIDTIDPSSSLSSSASPILAEGSAASSSRYERILRDEERYQAKQYPSYAEVPGCMQLFDEFMMCYALVPQLRSFYRHAEFRDCTYKFQDFKYCLSLKSESEEKRTELWTKRRAEWWARRRFGGSSEDVWGVRDTPPPNFPPVYPEEAAEAPDVKIVT